MILTVPFWQTGVISPTLIAPGCPDNPQREGIIVSNFSGAWVPSLEIRPPPEREAETARVNKSPGFLQSTGTFRFPRFEQFGQKIEKKKMKKEERRELRTLAPQLPQGSFCSLQLRVLRLGFFQDGDVGVGVFPEREEILVSGERTDPRVVRDQGTRPLSR
jgi:hypothetical protein